VYFNVSLNNLGALTFQGIISTDKGVHVPGENYIGLGMAVFKADRFGRIANVVSPGDTAPGGGKFDVAGMGGSWLNNIGDVAFTAHVAGEESTVEGFPPQAQIISALSSLYVRKARGTIVSVAHSGQAAPRGGVFRLATSPVMNDWGDIVFQGDLSPAPHVNQVSGVLLETPLLQLAQGFFHLVEVWLSVQIGNDKPFPLNSASIFFRTVSSIFIRGGH
jgi:hypothetical protein